mmetsp:Transcript_11368/g.25885  ORF Transcript_11368/g.25885 Transcript_11368/m.25885 type:complete len:404 (+) Transcript_11368:264-1475(+)
MMEATDEDVAALFGQPPPPTVPRQQVQQQPPVPGQAPAAPYGQQPAAPPQQQPAAPPQPQPQHAATAPPAGGPTNPPPLYDALLDVPHPSRSSSRIRLVYPPSDGTGRDVLSVLPPQTLAGEFGDEDGDGPAATGAVKVARFAFPKYEDGTNADERRAMGGLVQRLGLDGDNSNLLTRHDAYLGPAYSLAGRDGRQAAGQANNFSASAAASAGGDMPSCHSFSHRLPDGTVVHGHVRHSLPPLPGGGGRRDVGRRSPRALVLITRNPDGRGLYGSLLKTLEVVSLRAGLPQEGDGEGDADGRVDDARRKFLHGLFRRHAAAARAATAALAERAQAAPSGRGKESVLSRPQILTVPLVETGSDMFAGVDAVKYTLPSNFVHPTEGGDAAGYSRNDIRSHSFSIL